MKTKLLAYFLLGILFLVSCSKEQKPNVVIFFADDLGWNDLGVNNNDPSYFRHTPNIAKDFQAAGYTTGAFGKWHNGMPNFPAEGNGQRVNFDTVKVWNELHQVWTCDLDNGIFDNAKGYTTDLITKHAMDFIEINEGISINPMLGSSLFFNQGNGVNQLGEEVKETKFIKGEWSRQVIGVGNICPNDKEKIIIQSLLHYQRLGFL